MNTDPPAEPGNVDDATPRGNEAEKPGRTLDELEAAIHECFRALGTSHVPAAVQAETCDRLADLWSEVVRGEWPEIQPRSAYLLLSTAAADARSVARQDAGQWRELAVREEAAARSAQPDTPDTPT